MNRRTRTRARYLAQSGVLVALATCSLILALALTRWSGVRADLTASGANTLDEATRALVEQADGEILVVASVSLAGHDREARQRLADTLDAFERSSRSISTELIDAGRAGEADAQIERTVGFIRERFASELETRIEVTDRVTSLLDELAGLAQAVRAALGRADIEAFVRERPIWAGQAQRLGEARAALERGEAAETLAGVFDQAVRTASASLGTVLPAAERAGVDETLWRGLEADLSRVRDLAGVGSELIGRLPPRRAEAAELALRERETVLIVGPEDVSAIPFERLYVSGADGRRSLDARGGIVRALRPLIDRRLPIVVLAHAEAEPLGSANSRLGSMVRSAVADLHSQGIDVVEWEVVGSAVPPGLSTIANASDRPVVYLLPARPGSLGSFADRQATREREGRLAEVLGGLVDRGECVLVSFGPSDLPGVGSADPLAGALDALGVRVRTGLVMLRMVSTPTGDRVVAEQRAVDGSSRGVIGRAVRSLAVALPIAVPIEIRAQEGVDAIAEVSIEAETQRWGESQWLSALRGGGRLPTPNEQRDWVGGPWPVVVSAERRVAGRAAAQRILVVGGAGWLNPRVYANAVNAPGNAALLRSGIAWLAHQEERAGAGASAGGIPRIGPLSSGERRAIRWGLLIGLPVVVLAGGLVVRWVRG